ncbi:MAG: hypothetical protein KF847_06945 [Pirellulales bacterium]|nr:hypothetical protein [Pirellulales bacterium]
MQTRTHRRNMLYGLIAAAGIVQFVVAVSIAISHYPERYSLASNFLSDLGRGVTHAGADNRTAATVFNGAILCLGASLAPFFVVMPASLAFGRGAMSVLGILTALGLAALGLTPYDRYEQAHYAALALWLGPLVLMVPLYLASQAATGAVTRASLGAGAGLVLAAVLYAAVGGTSGAMLVQKLVVAAAACWFACLVAGVSIETYRSVATRQQIADRQARRYLDRMGDRLPLRARARD